MGFQDDKKLSRKKYEAVDAEFQGIRVEIDWLAMENPRLGSLLVYLRRYTSRKKQNRRWKSYLEFQLLDLVLGLKFKLKSLIWYESE